MPRKIPLLIAATAGLAFAALAPVSSQAAPANGAFAPNVGTDVVQVVCVRKNNGKVECGYYDRYGNFHEGEGGYEGGERYERRERYEGGYGRPSGYTCVEKSSGRVVCGFYDPYGNFHQQ
jgi:uncharacterized protein YodC (DUF2158 family)